MNKTFWWIVAVIIVVLAVWAFVNKSGTPLDLSGSPSPSASASPSATVNSGTGSTTYTALVAQYGTNRIQFDAGCQAIPKIAVFKTGTKVMFDNRSGDARKIMINGVTYNFPGYGYRILTLSSTTLPKTILLDCGSGQNVGTITIEK